MTDLHDYYRGWTRETLDEHRRAILAELERLNALEEIPPTVADLARRYKDGGGDPDTLRAAIE